MQDFRHARILTLFLALGCACASQVAAEEAPTADEATAKPAFAVIKISRGHELAYEAVAIPGMKSRMDEVRKAAKKEVAEWEAARAEHVSNKEKKGEPFLDRKPEEARVSTDKEFTTLEEAQAWAEERQRKADGNFAIVEIHDTYGGKALKVIHQKKFNAMKEAQKRDFEKGLAAYEKARTTWENDPSHWHPLGDGSWDRDLYMGHLPEKPELKIRKADIKTREEADKLLSDLEKLESE